MQYRRAPRTSRSAGAEIHLDAVDQRLEGARGRLKLPMSGASARPCGVSGRPPSKQRPARARHFATSARLGVAVRGSSAASSTARQKSQTATMALRLSAGSTRNE